MNYFVRISYDGTDFGGWQRQANHPRTIQQTIEAHLSETFDCQLAITGCGRTDAGVHASQFYFYMNAPHELQSNFLFFMNKKLPNSITFLECIPVDDSAHVCIDAQSRTYDYFFHYHPDAILARTSSQIDLEHFNTKPLAEVFSQLISHDQYHEFCLTPDRHNSTSVDISNVSLFQSQEGNRFRIQFTADRFLRGMIRILVHDLLLVGTKEYSVANFVARLDGRKHEHKVHLAPPQGLFLTGVRYPYSNQLALDREPDLPFCGCCDWETLITAS